MAKTLPAKAGDTGLISGPGSFHMLQGDQACEPQLLSTCAENHTQRLWEATAMRTCTQHQRAARADHKQSPGADKNSKYTKFVKHTLERKQSVSIRVDSPSSKVSYKLYIFIQYLHNMWEHLHVFTTYLHQVPWFVCSHTHNLILI